MSTTATIQLSVLLGIALVAKAFGYWLDRYDLVTSSGKLVTGMGYTDQHAVLPARNILVGVALICAVLFFLTVWRRTWLLPGVGISLLLVTSILLGLIWPAFVQHFQVNPSEAGQGVAVHREEHRGHARGVRPQRRSRRSRPRSKVDRGDRCRS